MFKAVIDDSKLFKDSISLINELVSEGVFEVSNEGMKLIAMDPASVAMIIFHLLPSAFSSFSAEGKQKIGLSIDKLRGILRRLNGGERLAFGVEESNFIIEIYDKYKRKFSLPLLDLDGSDMRIPSLEFTSKVELKADVLKSGVEDAGVISDSIIFMTDTNKFVMHSAGDNNEVTISLDPSNTDALVNLECKEASKAKYSIEYLNKMVKAGKIADKLTLNFKNDYPLRLDYSSLDNLKVSFILAPRVDAD